jgi:hypothetical protein
MPSDTGPHVKRNMKIEIKDNFLEKDLIDYLCSHFKLLPHYYGHTSTGDSIPFYASNLNLNDPLYNFLCFKISKLFPYSIEIMRTYINVQYCFMEGSFHQDDGDTTILLMITPTLKSKSGCFEIKDNNNKLKSVNFVQNRLILFPASWYHRGCAPIENNIPRITLAFKIKKI